MLSGNHVLLTFRLQSAPRSHAEKGSVTVNGVSLTVCEPTANTFKVAIIPYTREHTNFRTIEIGSVVNIEFDILGKYIARLQDFK